MSFTLVAEVMKTKVGSPLKKIILIKLADQANDDGMCWPSYESISKSCEICKRSVIKHISELEKMGFLRIERRYNKGAGKNFSNKYHLTLGGSASDALVHMSVKGGALDALGGALDAPEPTNDPTNDLINKDIAVSKEKKTKQVKTKSFNAHDYQIPSFVDVEIWCAFHDMRNSKKKNATEYACKLLVNKLTKFNEAGLDANAALEKSITNAWTDVFEPKSNSTVFGSYQNNSSNNKSTQSSSSSFDEMLDAQMSESDEKKGIYDVN